MELPCFTRVLYIITTK